MAAPKVPSIPTIAMDSITDRNVYAVLRAIADILNVRNGQTGDSDSAFVTRGEIGNLRAGGSIIGVPGAQQSQGGTFPVIRPSDIARVINDLQAQVMESPLFKALGERVNKVDAPGTGVIAQLDEERVTRANDVSSLVQQVTTLSSSVDANSVALQEEAQTRADADGNIFGKYSVKIDANGYVSGFGLISSANNSTPFSEFIFRADRFAIASPTGPGVPTRIPFIVVTTPQVVNGYTVPAGVYIDAAAIAVASIGEAQINFAAIRQAHIQNAAVGNAQIQNAAISYAKIGDAEVDTLKIRGEAVTIPRAANGTFAAGVPYTQTAVSVYVPPGASAVSIVGVVSMYPQDDFAAGNAQLYRDGTMLFAMSSELRVPGMVNFPIAWQDAYSGGGTYSILVNGPSSGTATILCIGTKR